MQSSDPQHKGPVTIPPPLALAAAARPLDGSIGDAQLADAIRRGSWDVERDLVVLVGSSPAQAAGGLRRLGQQRILWFRTGDEVEADPPAGVLRVDHLDEVEAAVRALGVLGDERIGGRALEAAQAPLYDQVTARIERTRGERALCGEPGCGIAVARVRLEQGLANLPALCLWPGAEAIGGVLSGAPLIIVAPGPSLAHNIDVLRGLRGRAIVLALSHAVVPLLAAGVTPDFVLAADGHDVSYHLAGADLSGIGALIATATAHPHLFRSSAPRKVVLSEPGPIDAWLAELVGGAAAAGDGAVLLPSGGSVAHVALALALRWGCDPIGFVGLDLACPGGRVYVEHCPDGEVRAAPSADGRSVTLEGWGDGGTARRGRELASERQVEVPGWDGNPLSSTFHLSMAQRWFEETARRVAGAVRLYNCSEGGAYIGGMRHIRLAGLASRLPPPAAFQASAVVARAIAQIEPRVRRRAARERLIELALELRRHQSPLARETVSPVPLLSALVDAEMAGEPRGARGIGEVARRSAALRRWAAWLEPRAVEAERALARQDRTSETMRIRVITSSVGGDPT